MILVTGGTGLLGSALVRTLTESGEQVFPAGRKDGDLVDTAQTFDLFRRVEPKIVYHLAATVGGIGANQASPADFWRENLMMGVNVLEACRLAHVEKLVLVLTCCSYPKVPPRIPFLEDDLFMGYPEDTNSSYGVAKRSLLAGSYAYRTQYGVDTVSVIPTNLFGPGDVYDLHNSHVIPAMIRKFHEAKESGKPPKLWGTGNATRDFLYVDDAAEALALAKDKLTDGLPVNLGSGRDISIKELADTVASVVGYDGPIDWDALRPDGQPRRVLDTSRAKKLLNWKPKITLHEGLKRTYTSYVQGQG